MKSKILKELKNADDYISGQQLCERLGVSRTAVWKHIKALRAEGYEIDSVTNKGYKLMMEPDLLRSQKNRRWEKEAEDEAGWQKLEQGSR